MAGRARRPVAGLSAFWDASALVPLCVAQSNTPQAKNFYRRFRPVVWWATQVEIASALARLVRMQQLTPADWADARNLAARLADSWSVIQPTEAVRKRAIEIIQRYDLPAADAFQLAAGLEWCQNSPQGRILLTSDDRLLQAALMVGFAAKCV